MHLDSKLPSGPIETAWDRRKFEMKLVNPANKRKYSIIVVGSGLAGGAASATFAELGYNVKCFCFQDSPRRAHSIAAQGGINAAKNYQNDGDSVFRLFYDTVKGGDFRSREPNVHRLAQISLNIIDQCVAQGVPFAREYGGTLSNRSFGGAQVSRTFYARGQTGQQLLLGAYQAMESFLAEGRARAIGVSNFSAEHLRTLIDRTDVVPAVNQVEIHPYFSQPALRAVHADLGILTQAWSPIGGILVYVPGSDEGRGPLTDPVVTALATKYDKTPAQVVLRWHVEHGTSAIPKSVKAHRIAENFGVFDFSLTADEVATIDALDKGVRGGPDPEKLNRDTHPKVVDNS